MKRTANKLVIVLLLLVSVAPLFAQKDIIMSQYMHNRYALNTAFAGNRDVLSLYGGFRQKWAGMEGAPQSMLFSAHSPLKKENVALGFELFNQTYGVNKQTGFTLSYTYRLKMAQNKTLAFSLNGGGNFYSADWNKVNSLDATDPNFASSESNFSPTIGFGSAWYSKQFFVGFSVPNFFNYDPYTEGGTSSFALNKANYLVTGGYLFELAKKWHLQPSFMIRYNPEFDTTFDINATVIYNNMLWLGTGFRSTKDIVAMVGYQITPQLRFSYSYDYVSGDINTYNSGSHEIAIQYDFGFKVKTPNPKFF